MTLMQLVLDFFAVPPPPAAAGSKDTAGAEKNEPKVPPAQVGIAPVAPEKRAKKKSVPVVLAPVPAPEPAPAPVPRLPAAAAPGTATPAAVQEFRHPQACRALLLAVQAPRTNGEAHASTAYTLVAFALERVPRRSIGFTVSAAGLAVRAPTRMALAAVDAAVQRKAGWIVQKLHDTRTRAVRQAHAAPAWQDGAVLPYLGTLLRVRVDPAAPAAGELRPLPWPSLPELPPAGEGEGEGEAGIGSGGWELRIRVPALHAPGAHGAELQAAALRRAVHAWMLCQARVHFSARLDHFAPLLGVQWRQLALTNARTRWGSAKADGSIRLHWRLLHCAPAVLDYVVVHELAHLRVMDHSPRFWATVASVLPDHAALRRRLRSADIPRWEP